MSETDTAAMRHCFALDLRDEPVAIAAYEQRHRPGGPPAAVTRALRSADIRGLEIWRCGPRLFMVLDAGPDYDLARRAANDEANPQVVAWERLMERFQQPLPWAAPGEKWVAATRIYKLADQPE